MVMLFFFFRLKEYRGYKAMAGQLLLYPRGGLSGYNKASGGLTRCTLAQALAHNKSLIMLAWSKVIKKTNMKSIAHMDGK